MIGIATKNFLDVILRLFVILHGFDWRGGRPFPEKNISATRGLEHKKQ